MKKLFTATLLVLIGFTLTGCTLLGNKDKTNNSSGDIRETEEKKSESITSKVADLFSMNSNKECTYTVDLEGVTSTGHMYISGKRVFNTSTLTMEGKEQTMNYILDGDWMYSWGTGIPSMKMNVKELQKNNEKIDTPEGNTEEISYDKLGLKEDMDLNCKDWGVDTSKFDLPKGIEFKDVTQTLNNFSKQFEQTNQKVETMKEDMCSACDMTPDETTKKECLASLGCK